MSEYNPIARQYEDDILSGKQPAGKLLIAAIKRQRKDLREGHKRGLWFDHEAGQRILDFAELINIAPETPIILHPSQVWELYVFYGWKREDGRRRFRFKYKSCARGNGKTPVESLQVLYHLTIDGPFKAEAYVSATKEDQAKIAFNDAKNMLEFSPDLQDVLSSSAETIYNLENKAKFGFLTSNPKTADGTRPTFAIIDEYHEFDNEDMVGKLKTGLIKTANPILNIVTTRGTDKSKPCYQAEEKFYIPIVKGIIENDGTFVVIHSLDPEDYQGKDASKWRQPDAWGKANPMMGQLIRMDDMQEALKEATQKGAKALADFKTLNLNLWVDAESAWIDDEIYQAAGRDIKLEDFEGRLCYGGLDLARRDDFCSFCLLFPRSGQHPTTGEETVYFDAFWWHWIPKSTVNKRIGDGLVSLQDWIDEGYIIPTDGNVTDYSKIERHIKDLSESFSIAGISYDSHNIGNLDLNLVTHGLTMNVLAQTTPNLSEPTKQLEYAIREERFNHGFDPVMRWQFANVAIYNDGNDNIRISKKSSREKVDGVAAAVNAMAEYLTQGRDNSANVYEERGFIEL